MKQISEHNNLVFYTASIEEVSTLQFNEPVIVIANSSELILTLLEKFSSQIKLIVDIGDNLKNIIEKLKAYKHCTIEASNISEAVNIVKLFKSSAKNVIYFQPENEANYKTAIELN
jgi:hypothetical protein